MILRFLPAMLFLCLLGCSSESGKDIAKSAFLRPYVAQLKTNTPPAELARIRAMAKSELILLHHGYGTGIRNQWLWGDRNPELVKFFHGHGIDHADDMSMVLIEALWYDLNSNLTSAERTSIEANRATVARRRASYEALESQCEKHLRHASAELERCYTAYGLPSKNPSNREPFYRLVVEKTGRVREIVFFEGDSSELKQHLQEIIDQFRFEPFADNDMVTIYILEFPHCRVAERDTLHDR
jgi:hypothetical protein